MNSSMSSIRSSSVLLSRSPSSSSPSISSSSSNCSCASSASSGSSCSDCCWCSSNWLCVCVCVCACVCNCVMTRVRQIMIVTLLVFLKWDWPRYSVTLASRDVWVSSNMKRKLIVSRLPNSLKRKLIVSRLPNRLLGNLETINFLFITFLPTTFGEQTPGKRYVQLPIGLHHTLNELRTILSMDYRTLRSF